MMAESRIPVDLFNPGQVFACLGFMELADVLLGDAEAGFDWSDRAQAAFHLSAAREKNPFDAVLDFLKAATVKTLRPAGVDGPWPQAAVEIEEFPAPLSELLSSDAKKFTASALPISLESEGRKFNVSNWLEGDKREALKLFAGQQVAAKLMTNVLCGDSTKQGTVGVRQLSVGPGDPFKTGPVGGRFGYDARGAWDAINTGSSLDEQGATLLVSPVVEALAVVGLEHTRPEFLSTYEIRYAVWQGKIPVSLARVVFTQPRGLVPRDHFRCFRAHLGDDKQYKKCFPATEELIK
jgi:CRISPR-associated protein Csx14